MATGSIIQKVLVVGAGPVGLLTALMLAKIGISVDIVEANHEIDSRPRGAAYGPSAVRVLRLAGISDKVRAAGIDIRDMAWRELGGEYITGIKEMDDPDYADRFIMLPVHLLAQLLYAELKQYSNAKVLWRHKFTGLNQDDRKVVVSVENEMGVHSLDADYVVGCDGARSEVRKALFGKNFPGRSWEVQIVATNIRYEGFDRHGWSDCQWIVHPEHWCIACRLDKENTWRVGYGEAAGLDPDELRARLASKMEKILPGNPKEGDYEVLRFNPYVMHQRCAERMQVGRVLLAGDAAHLCNPMGGLGLTGGLADVGSLVDCLRGIHQGQASPSILEKYGEKRRQIYLEVTDPLSTANFKCLFLDGKAALQEDEALQRIEAASKVPGGGRELQKALDVLTVDMTEFYDLQDKLSVKSSA